MGYVKYIHDEDGNVIRVPDDEKNITEQQRLENEIAALQAELAALKLIEDVN
tara:strand:+ start:547 stop:702 length:156 start_codon:yes stop_codon:yes gene_type:complete